VLFHVSVKAKLAIYGLGTGIGIDLRNGNPKPKEFWTGESLELNFSEQIAIQMWQIN